MEVIPIIPISLFKGTIFCGMKLKFLIISHVISYVYYFRSIKWANLAYVWPTPINTTIDMYLAIEYPVPTNACFVLNFSEPNPIAGDSICYMWGDSSECRQLFPGLNCDVENYNSVSASTGINRY